MNCKILKCLLEQSIKIEIPKPKTDLGIFNNGLMPLI
jgi:hypothetical protein